MIEETQHVADCCEGDDGHTEYGVRCEVPSTDGGMIELEISEDHHQRPELATGRVYLGLYRREGACDHAFGCVLTPSELDALIANLVALRYRAHTIGILGGVR